MTRAEFQPLTAYLRDDDLETYMSDGFDSRGLFFYQSLHVFRATYRCFPGNPECFIF